MILAASLASSGFVGLARGEGLHGAGREALPCNALCRAWMGMEGPGDAASPAASDGGEGRAAPARRERVAAPAPKREPARAEARTARAAPRPEPRKGPRPETGAAQADRPTKATVRPASRAPTVDLARAAMRLPVVRPASRVPPRAATAGEPLEGTALSSSPPAAGPETEPAGPAPAAAVRAAPQPPGRAEPPRPSPAPAATPAAPAPEPTRMAALPPAAAIRPAETGAPEGERAAALPPSGPLPVQVGRVSAEGGKTDVHVVVVNVLPGDVRDVDVRCEALDAQGMQVGDARTRIASIARADVAFGDVLFPSGLTAANSRFTCVADRFAAPAGAGP